MSERPILEELLGAQLDECERVLRLERSRRPESSDSVAGIIERGRDHHFTKADGHICSMGVYLDGVDRDTGALHSTLATLRLLFTTLCITSDNGLVEADGETP